ncbi:GtrA family protein [Pseudomonas indica]|uniref:GtrA-like protein n=1 Tax=Pseudomonas indica TaxID=137658 RepID=A0A1G9MB08_9PSED|nr:GtrA family protein [Pseudomonas indica]MBU3057272.1 GtrA family protein [Pseudomonas indica]SDL70845.1 GtrA-like protein [Pseudomonas indica]
MKLAAMYALFAAVATATNIGTQDAIIRMYDGPFALLLSIIAGTGTGLLVKYILDKRYIFSFQARDIAEDSRTFLLYALMGVVTTVVFWGFEFLFEFVFATKEMRYLGGVIGLAIGYFTKYELDKRYVFGSRSA